MAARIGLRIEVGDQTIDAHLPSMAFVAMCVIAELAQTVDVMVFDPETKTLKRVEAVTLNGDAVQLTVE